LPFFIPSSSYIPTGEERGRARVVRRERGKGREVGKVMSTQALRWFTLYLWYSVFVPFWLSLRSKLWKGEQGGRRGQQSRRGGGRDTHHCHSGM